MSEHPTNFTGSIHDAIRTSIEKAIADARVEVQGGGGHYSITVTSAQFQGKTMLEKHRLVMASIAHLMNGDMAPVHAVDSLKTLLP